MSIFDSIKLGKGKRNSFDLSHNVKLSTDIGVLTPFLCQEVIPDDTFKVDSEVMVRMAPMIAPIMHDVNVYVHYFFVPNRLIWSEWREFITGGEDGKDDVSFPRVQVPSSYLNSGSLADYLGFPTVDDNNPIDGSSSVIFNALPFRAFNLIWNEYYRDQNLEPEININKDVSGVHNIVGYTAEFGSGEVTYTPKQAADRFFGNKYRAWEKDYFTSALPWTQRGETVRLPLQGEADLTVVAGKQTVESPIIVGEATLRLKDSSTGLNPPAGQGLVTASDPAGNATVGVTTPQSNGQLLDVNLSSDSTATTPLKAFTPTSNIADALKADMTTVTSTTINELRRSYALQRWLERNAFGGSRYIEQILSHFGVRSSDARLQRPEYLGGGKAPIRVSQVLQTSESTDTSALGTMAGHGLAVGKSNKFKKYFEEHGWVIGILSVIPRSVYQQGLPRQFSKFDKLDYAWPEFGHLGEQAVFNKELYFDFSFHNTEVQQGVSTNVNNQTFGYQSRYAEYKQISNRVCGDFKTTLDFWHLGRIFNGRPYLNSDFVHVKPSDASRIWAVNNYVDEATGEEIPLNHLWIQINNRIKAQRQLPYYGTPI